MEYDEIVVKESPGLCRCCLSEGCYKDLGTEYAWMNETEVYADMLLECFDISITQHNEGPNGPNRLICEVCITRLRDACNFKKQVLESEKRFIDLVGRGEFRPKVLIYQTQMKAEDNIEEVPVEDVEYLDDEIDFGDDEPSKHDDTPNVTDDIAVDALPVKGKRGRPRKSTDVKTPKKMKIVDEKPKTSKAVAKGVTKKGHGEAQTKPSMSATERNRLMKRNAITILETSTVVPFKWHRQNYLCFYCHFHFKNTESLKEHTVNEHGKSNIKVAVLYLRRDEKVKIDVSEIKCKLCDDPIENFTKLVEHLKVVHERTFSEACGYGLIPYKIQTDHYQCAVCNEQFQYFIKLNQHMNEHYGNYVCELCGKSFLSQDRLRCHFLSHGSGFKCNVCAESFDSLTRRNKHEATVHNKSKRLKCFYCTEVFQNYAQRKQHHRIVHDLVSEEFNCPVCGKSFQIMSKMKVHLKEVHVREKNFACTVCEQKFFSKTHVQKHMVKHCGERVHQCDVCRKSYARRQTLRDHMKIHNDERRFICSVCSQAFVQNNSLRLHMRVHHPDVINA